MVLALGAVLRVWNLGRDGFGYPYYAAAARSMAQSWHNFFFVAFDGAGAVAVDKPPLALWVQSASVRAFGWHGLALLLPSVCVGLGAIALLYGAVKQTHGHIAGLVAALVLAVTPVSVATDRLNLPDPFLHLLLVGAAWCVLCAIPTSKIVPLVFAALLIGAGFNAKMGGALIVVPGFALAFLLGGAKNEWRRRIHVLILATFVLVPACFWWVWTVDATPPAHRPYIAGSGNNTARGLLSGYNGWGRVSGTGFYQLTPTLTRRLLAQSPIPPVLARRGLSHPFDGGIPGAGRLLSRPLAPLVGWLYPPALCGLVLLGVSAWRNRTRPRTNPAQSALLVWGTWLMLLSGVFSIARGTFHPYYLAALAPPLAALGGIGVALLWQRAQTPEFVWRNRLALPAVLLVTAAWQTVLARHYTDWAGVLIPLILLGAGVCAALLTALAAEEATESKTRPALARGAAGIGGAVLLLSPLVWAFTPARARNSPILPTAGPEVTTGYARLAAPGAPPAFVVRALAAYLAPRQRAERFLSATGTTFMASSLIIETGQPVLALGGFTGGDPVVSPRELARRVQTGQIRFVVATHWEAQRSPENLPALFNWAQAHGRTVPRQEWCPDITFNGSEREKRAAADWIVFDLKQAPSGSRAAMPR